MIIGYAAVAWLIRQDMQWRSAGSRLLLVPGIFLGIIGSRPVSYWLGTAGTAEGNPANTAFFSVVIAVAIVALSFRIAHWGEFLANNKAVLLLYGFFLVSSLWSIDPGTSAKRLVKDFACVLVALTLLTESRPENAVRAVFIRVSYVLFLLSVVFGKYLPSVGRSYSNSGEPVFTGVTPQKNSLGEITLVFGLFLIVDFADLLRNGGWRAQRKRVLVNAVIIAMGLWLLFTSNSKTSLVCLLIGTSLFLSRSWFVRRRNGKPILIALLILATGTLALDSVLGFSETVLKALDRDPTLTGRTRIWSLVLDQQHEPFLGGGFYMFWDSEKGQDIAANLVTLNSAHSGYVETYLDGGVVGCVALGVFLLTTGAIAIRRYFDDSPFSPLALPLWAAAVAYNISETSFLRLDPLWLALLVVSLQVPAHAVRTAQHNLKSHLPLRPAFTPAVRLQRR